MGTATTPTVHTKRNNFEMMSTRRAFLTLTTIVATGLLASCGSGSKISKKTFAEANALTAQGRYAEAYNEYITNATAATWDSTAWRYATIAASETSHDSIACVWGMMTSSTADTVKLRVLDKSLSRLGRETERTTLVLANKPVFIHILGKSTVADIEAKYYATTADDRIVEVYPTLTNNTVKAEVFDVFIKKAQNSLEPKEIEMFCVDVLKSSPEQQTALRYMGQAKYKAAEEKYAKAMNEYNKKKSQAAYAYLTRDLKKYVTPLYKESRTYFEKVHKADPSDKTVIKYLININDRLSNEAEVKRLKKLL